MNKLLKRVKLAIATIILCGVVAIPAIAQDTIRLTLDEALSIALNESLTVKIADKEIEKTGYTKKGSYSALFPNVDFSAAYQRTI